MNLRFNKYDKIRHQDQLWQCICQDHEVAVFGKVNGTETSYEDTFVISNKDIGDSFEYEMVYGDDMVSMG